jgi:hypothetical protein
MRRVILASTILLSGCAVATVERSTRNEVAVATAPVEQRLNFAVSIRVRQQQVFLPSRADGQEEFCSSSPTFFVSNSVRPMPMCFRDLDRRGRFNRAYTIRESRSGGGVEVNIPYTLQAFPCSPCVVSAADLTEVTDPQLLADHSIAPAALRPFVQVALTNPLQLDAAITQAAPHDPEMVKATALLAAREVRDRRAIAICSANNPGGAAALFGVIGNIATIAGGLSEGRCMDAYMETGAMPILPPRPAPTTP